MQKVYESAHAIRASILKGETVTLVGGTFDLLHVGHLHLLDHSKKLEHVLIVCVLSDANVKSYKGSSRPIIGERYRAEMVAALRCVDYVYVSDIDTSHPDTLSVIRPDSVVFGIDDTILWREASRKREEFIRSHFSNVKIHYLERFADPTVSTSSFVNKILTS